MVLYAATIFVSAFLLFQVQPMVARFILPWFGGSSLVWTTCMLFFQSALVCGYAYAHLMNQRMKPRTQWISHMILLVAAICFLPIRPTDFWKPEDASMPTARILALLAVSVGLPFFLLSMTGPLLQSWQSKTHPDRSPYRLFALSNFASLAALISYPFLIERYMTVDAQSWMWSGGFALFALLAICTGARFAKVNVDEPVPVDVTTEKPARRQPISPARWLLWMILPMLASIQLLATTNLMTQEIGSLPFLWIVPLSLYLISFIICFDHPRWFWRPFFYLLFFASAIASAFVLEAGAEVPILMQIIGYSAVCFGAAMCCHGELARSKPDNEHLTMFYLLISVGGALGGVFVAVIAPRIFVRYYEFQIGIIAAILFCLLAYGMQAARQSLRNGQRSPDGPDGEKVPQLRRRPWSTVGFAVTLFAGLLVSFFVVTSVGTQWVGDNKDSIHLKSRNEYGTLTVKDFENYRKLTNGEIEHGFQFKGPDWINHPTSYYGPDSGLGIAIDFLHEDSLSDQARPIDIGAIGLGVGTVCSWCEEQDTIRFFEINPDVLKVAENEFWYLEECLAKQTEVVLGDARLQLEREIARNDPRKYDVLVADAFSSDSIPVHLLTLESMEIYKQRMKPNGILAVHVSNRFLALENIVKVLADELGMKTVLVDDYPPKTSGLYNSSSWVLVTNNAEFVDYATDPATDLRGKWPEARYTARWTDDFSSIVPVIKMNKDLKWFEDFEWFQELMEEKGWWKKKKDDSE